MFHQCALHCMVYYSFQLQIQSEILTICILLDIQKTHKTQERTKFQPKSKFAIRAFSLKNRIWSSFSGERLARWSVATRPPYEKSLSTFVELGGGVRCCRTTLSKAFLRVSEGEAASSYCCQNLHNSNNTLCYTRTNLKHLNSSRGNFR